MYTFSEGSLVLISVSALIVLMVVALLAYERGRRNSRRILDSVYAQLTRSKNDLLNTEKKAGQADQQRHEAEETARSTIADYKEKVRYEVEFVLGLFNHYRPFGSDWKTTLHNPTEKEAVDRILNQTDAAGANSFTLQNLIRIQKTEGKNEWELSISNSGQRVVTTSEVTFILPSTNFRIRVPWKQATLQAARTPYR